MSDDQCTATTQTGFGVVRCQLPTGHPEHHTNQQYRWYGGYPNSTTSPVPVCTDTIWVSDEIGTVACSLGQGHATDHVENTTGRALHWPLVDRCLAPDPEPVTDRATRHYSSNNLAGVSYEDLIRDLFRRVEQLEQLARPTASCASEELRQGLGEVEKRMTRLEQAPVYGPHDLSALQASITDHMNRALTEWGSGLASLLTEQHEQTADLFRSIWAVLKTMAPVIDALKPDSLRATCGKPDLAGLYHCEEGHGHGGRHRNGTSSWPNPCGATHSPTGTTCIVVKGHTTEHRSDLRAGSGRVGWTDLAMTDIGAVTEAENKEAAQALGLDYLPPDGAQNERASASPAAVRCPAQFREGQCLGYAGHEGECSALPDPGEPQLEDPGEFDECGKDPAPGHAMPPCGRPAGHTGVCASGPQYGGEDEPGEEDNYPEQNFYS